MVDDSAFEVFYSDVEMSGGGFQNQPFYKGSEGKGKSNGKSLKMKLEGRMQGHEMELTWHAGGEGDRVDAGQADQGRGTEGGRAPRPI